MAKLVSKVYGDALFEAALEDNRLSGLSDEVTAVKEIIAAMMTSQADGSSAD